MSHSAQNNPRKSKGFKPNKLTLVLGGIIVVLLIATIAMILMIPGEEQIQETVPPTQATELPTETTEPPAPTETEQPTIVEVVGGEDIPPTMLTEMAELYQKNSDVAGWLKIDGTVIDYPVMYTPDFYLKYLYTSFEGKYKFRGELFIEGSCSMDPESQILLIHGHNMNDGTMFQCLLNYKNMKYWENHPTITFKTLYEERTYEIFAAFRDKIYGEDEDVFKYYEFFNPTSAEEFDQAVQYYKDKSTYDMGVDVAFGDRILLLSTCDRSVSNGRFVVAAKLVKDTAAE